MKFKKFFATILLLVVSIHIIIPISISAANAVTIYNCGEDIETVSTNNINEIYVGLSALKWYNIRYKDNSDHLYLYNGYKNATVYRNSNIVNANGANLTYYNAVVTKSDNEHISLALLAMIFSQSCEVTEDSINLWMPYYPDNYVKGIVSLPESKVAPAGGVKVTVGVCKKVHSLESDSATPSIGYNGMYLYRKNYFDYTEEILTEQTIVIEEGENSTQYFLYTEDSFGTGSYVYYAVDDKGFTDEDKVSFSGKKEELYNFCIGENKCKIRGTIILSEASAADVDFCLIADGTNYYELYGTIRAGETSYEYSLNVGNECTYKVSIVFDEKAYTRTEYPEKLYVNSTNAENIDLYCEASSKIKVNVLLPDEEIRECDTVGYLFLQSAVKPHYYIDTRQFKIPAGENSVEINMIDDCGFDEYICFYEFKDNEDGLYDFGFYNSSGTVIDVENTELITINRKIKIELLKSKDIFVDFILPDGNVAEDDIYGTVMLVRANELQILNEVNACKTEEELEVILYKFKTEIDLSEYTSISDERKGYVLSKLVGKKHDSLAKLQQSLDYAVAKSDTVVGGTVAAIVDSSDSDETGEVNEVSFPSIIQTDDGEIETDGIDYGDITAYRLSNILYTNVTTEKTMRYNILLIDSGDTYGTARVKIPLTDDRFTLKITGIDSSDYYPDIYYNSANGSTVFYYNASIIDKTTEDFDISLMKNNKISGVVTNQTSYEVFEVWAVYQDDLLNLKEYYESKFACSTSQIGENGEYVIRVPAEISDFTVMLLGERTDIYYNSKGNSEELENAGIVNALLNPDNINFEYAGYDPAIPINLQASENNDGRITVEADNISDYEKKNVNIYLAMYEEDGRLIDIEAKIIDVVPSNGTNFTFFKVAPYAVQEASTIKVFAWSDGLKPYSEIEYIKENGVGDEQNTAMLWMKSGCSTITSYGDEIRTDAAPIIMNNVLMSTARPLAEALYWSAEWSAASNTMVFKYESNTLIMEVDSNTATYNGEPFELSNPVSIYNGRPYVPVIDVVEKFGYDAEFDYDTNELFVFYGAIDELACSARYRAYMPQYIFEKDANDLLSRYDAAQLITSLCETVIADELEITGSVIYTDTDDVNILKLGDAGIMAGISEGEFEPYRTMNNAEFATVLCRALTYIEEDIPVGIEKAEYFYNHNDIPIWARETVYKMKLYGALDGVYNQIFAARSPITIEKAIAVIENAFRESYDSLFYDIDPASGYKETVIRLSRLGILYGYDDGTFMPDREVMRSEFAALVARMLGEDESYDVACDDVDATHWAVHYIGYCIENGIMALDNNCYRPDESITNKEAIWGLMRALGYKELNSFADVHNTAEKIGLFNKVEDIDTNKDSRRIEIAQMIYNALFNKVVHE